jgi:hypothetical protein
MKLILAVSSPLQPSQATLMVWSMLESARTGSCTKKRTLRLPGGSNATTAWPAFTTSPGLK